MAVIGINFDSERDVWIEETDEYNYGRTEYLSVYLFTQDHTEVIWCTGDVIEDWGCAVEVANKLMKRDGDPHLMYSSTVHDYLTRPDVELYLNPETAPEGGLYKNIPYLREVRNEESSISS